MNPVCPGFMPHHVKPNRCRRCFRDTHDHDVNVATTFTIPLPRRRRESVAVDTTSRIQKDLSSTSATFTVTDSSSVGRRVRQRSASTSSWFQEKKENDVHNREKIDALFKNAEDSKATENDLDFEGDSRNTLRHRWRTSEDVSQNDETAKKNDSYSRKQQNEVDNESKSTTVINKSNREATDYKSSNNIKESEQNTTNKVDKTNVSPAEASKAALFTKPSDVKLKSAKFSKDNVETPPKIPPKSTDFRSTLRRVSDAKPSADVGEAQNKSTSVTNKEVSKITDKKPVISRFLDSPFAASKLDEKKTTLQSSKPDAPKVDLRTKESKISAVASRFEQPSLKTVGQTKELDKSKDSKPLSKPSEVKRADSFTESKKPEVKPVLSRFSAFRKEETPTAKVETKVEKPNAKPPSSSSSSEEESESEEESSDEPPPKPTSKTTTGSVQAKVDKSKDSDASSPEVAFVVKLKAPSPVPPDDKLKDQQKYIRDRDAEIRELRKIIANLKEELKKAEEGISKAQKEKSEIQKKQQQLLDKDKEALQKTASELTKMRSKLGDMQSGQDLVKDENKKLKLELEKSKKDLEKLKQDLEKSKQELDSSRKEMAKTRQELEKARQEMKRKESTPGQVQDPKAKQTIEQLKLKLQQTETLCQELMEENEDIKKEVRDLEQELEELHDNFREDQASEFRGLKKELETATKNCRVLQFKLRKAEKRCEQLELDRHSLEDKVREYQTSVRCDVDKGKTKELENELKMTRKLTETLNDEISALKEELRKSQSEYESLQRQQKGTRRSLTPTRQSRLSPVASREGVTTPVGKDHESLTRELYDTMERENDLREQLRFSEEEAKTARRKMNALEQENETLMLQMKKLNTLLRARANKGEKEDDEEEELSADNLKLQVEMQEQEMGVLRRKLEDVEKENESLQSEVKYLQEKIINQPLIKVSDLVEESSTSSSAGSAYWEKKARLLEHELRDTRTRSLEKEREIERLHTEVEIYRKKASKMMVRSRSLDGDLQVDLKRQLQLVEQEASILRQQVSNLESENEKLATENKRLHLRLSKKPPMSSAELAQLDNIELQQKNEELQRKINDLKQELLEKTGKNENPVAILQEYKPRRESLTSLTDSENDLIASLKKKLKALEEDHQAQQNKCMHLEIEHGRLSREYKRLKDSLSTRKKPLKVVRDSATRTELREIVNELQDEISELHVTLRGREVAQENLEEELERSRKEIKELIQDAQRKEEKLKDELQKTLKEKQALQKEAETQKKRASNAEEHLGQMSGQLSSDQFELSKKVGKMQEELKEAERKVKAAEDALEKKTRRLRETQEKLNTVTTLKDDLLRTNRLLESQKGDLAKELEDHRELLQKAESRITDLRNQMDTTDRDVTTLRKECNQLRNELEDERSRLKQVKTASGQDSSQHSLIAKDRDDLRRLNNELRNRIESLQQQITHNEQIWIEKESRLRDDHKKRKEAAVKEAREKGEAALELAREEEKILRGKVQEMSDKLEKAESVLKEAQEKQRSAASQHRRDKDSLQSTIDDLESQLRAETKKRERTEREAEQAQKQKQEELLQSKERLVQLEREQRRMHMQMQEAEEAKQKSLILEKDIDRIKQEYDDLTAKYEQLETEFVKTKSRLVQEKEQAETQNFSLQRDLNNLTAEFSMLKENAGSKQESLRKEKTELQERLKEYERRLERLKAVEQDRLRIKNQLEEKETLIESYRKEEKHLKEERERLRKSVEEMSKASEAQRQAWISSIASSDKGGAATKELMALKAEYEGRMAIMSSEITSMQKQIKQLAAERDALKSRLNTAERSAEEMKTGSLKRERARHREEAEMARRKVKEVRTQMEDLKEQLDDMMLENKNLKLQIETDRNTADIQLSEIKSKVNQLEEQKILETTRGQTRNIAKTRLELAWEKERSELQHLLTETQKLVEDLKTRLETSEKEKDKDKQNLRRQLNHMRELAEKDQHENRRKMAELHSSLLDMRESQAKLRGLYDRMKREREILLSEREEWRQRLHITQELHTKIQDLQKEVDVVASLTTGADVAATNVSRNSEWKESLAKVKEKCTEIHKITSEFKDDERLKRTTSFRRAVSAQDMNLQSTQDPSQRWNQPQRVTNYPVAPPSMILRPPPRHKALHRKSLSLDHTLGRATSAELLKIWESEGESVGSTPAGSLLSLKMGYESDSSFADSEYKYGGSLQERRMPRRYLQTPTDSEMGASSREGSIATSCESVPATVQNQQKKATLKDKLKLLRRAKSIDVSTGDTGTKKAKEESLRSKISKVLKKPMGRSVSMDVHQQKGAPALPPKGAFPEATPPRRPTAEKPLSASRGDLSTERPLKHSKSGTISSKSGTISSKSGRETPV